MEETLILTRQDITGLITPPEVLRALRDGFIAIASDSGHRGKRFPVSLPPNAPTGASGMLLGAGFVPGIPAYTIKVHSKFPGSKQALKGVIILHAIHDGRVLAILESTWLTNLRTGLAGALGADVLARSNANSAAIIAAGAQGRLQLECLLSVRDITHVRVYDLSTAQAEGFARNEGQRLKVDIIACKTVGEAVEGIDIVVTATWASEPFIDSGMIADGTHLTTLGPDQPNKAELFADLIQRSVFVADDIDLACEMGAIAGVGLSRADVHASLGEVLSGMKTGRTNDGQVTVFGAVGLPFQDLVCAWAAYEAARKVGQGRNIRFLD